MPRRLRRQHSSNGSTTGTQDRTGPIARRGVEFFDETLRDGIQNPSVVDPTVADKIQLLHLMNDLGIHHVDIGLPGAGRRATEDVLALAKEIAEHKMAIRAACACRTVVSDIVPVVEVSQKAGIHRGDGSSALADPPVPRVGASTIAKLSTDAIASPPNGMQPTSPRTPRGRVPTRSASSSAPRSAKARTASASATPSVTPRRTASGTSSASRRT
jgi:hypothetical protein